MSWSIETAGTSSNGEDDLHDRVWIVGETAVLVGNSIKAMLRDKAGRTTSASELPVGDAAFWRERFDTWWAAATKSGT